MSKNKLSIGDFVYYERGLRNRYDKCEIIGQTSRSWIIDYGGEMKISKSALVCRTQTYLKFYTYDEVDLKLIKSDLISKITSKMYTLDQLELDKLLIIAQELGLKE